MRFFISRIAFGAVMLLVWLGVLVATAGSANAAEGISLNGSSLNALPQVGGGGGDSAPTMNCPGGQIMTGLTFWRADLVREDGQSGGVGIQGLCSSIDAVTLALTPAGQTPRVLGSKYFEATPVDRRCPANSVLTGWNAWMNDRDQLIDAIQLTCSTFSLADGAALLGAPVASGTPMGKTSYRALGQSSCPANQVAGGFNAAVGWMLDRVGLVCYRVDAQTIDFTLDVSPPPSSYAGFGLRFLNGANTAFSVTAKGRTTKSLITVDDYTTTVVVPATHEVIGNGCNLLRVNAGQSANCLIQIREHPTIIHIAQTNPPSPVVGENAAFELTVRNAGLNPVARAQVKDALPADTDYVAAAGTGWTCANAAGQVTCNFAGSIASSATSTVTVVVRPRSTAANRSIVNRASVGTDGASAPDARSCTHDGLSCVVGAPLPVLNDSALQIGFQLTSTSLAVGTFWTGRVVLSNAGAGTVANTALKLSLPAGLSAFEVIGGAFTCVQASGVQTCTHNGTLALNHFAFLDFRAMPLASMANGQFARASVDQHGNAPITPASSCSLPAVCASLALGAVGSGIDLSVELAGAVPSYVVGKKAHVDLTVRNAGGGIKPNPIVMLALPAGLDLDASVPMTGVGCTAAVAGVHACTLVESAAAFGAQTVSIPVLPQKALGNRVSRIYASIDGAGGSSAAVPGASCTTARVCAVLNMGLVSDGTDISIGIGAPSPPLVAGARSVYDIQVDNRGSGDLVLPQFRLRLAPTLEFKGVSASTPAWNCNPSSAQVWTCNSNSEVPVGGSSIARVQVQPAQGSAGAAPVVSVGMNRVGPIADVDPGTACAIPVVCASHIAAPVGRGNDLRIAIAPPAPSLEIGARSTYVISVSNHGTGDATSAQARIRLPSGFDDVRTSGAGWTCPPTGLELTCAWAGTMAANGGASSVSVSAITTQIIAGGDVTVFASVDRSGADAAPAPGPSCAPADSCTSVTTSASGIASGIRLTVAWSESPVAMTVGVPAQYSLEISNVGLGASSAAHLNIALAPGFEFLKTDSVDWACRPEPADPSRVTCDSSRTLATGTELQLSIALMPTPSADKTSVVQHASIDSSGGNSPPIAGPSCTDTTQCASTAASSVGSGVAVSLAIDGPEPALSIGTMSSFKIRVANKGTEAAMLPRLRALVPAGMHFISASAPGWSCGLAGDVVTCQPAGGASTRELVERALPADASNEIELIVSPDVPMGDARYSQYASIAWSDPSTDLAHPGPGCEPAPYCVNSLYSKVASNSEGLSIIKAAGAARVEIGDTLVYRITVRNPGPGVAAGVVVHDRLPAGFRYVPGSTQLTRTGGQRDTSAPQSGATVLSFSVGSMQPGTSVDIAYRTRVGVGARPGTARNSAMAMASNGPSSSTTEAVVQVTAGVFSEDGCIAGKVFMDSDGNGTQSADEPGIAGAKIYMQNGMHFTTDKEGRYSFCGLKSRSNVLKIDKRSLPAGCTLQVLSNANLGDAGSIFLGASGGHLQRGDFAVARCEIPARRK